MSDNQVIPEAAAEAAARAMLDKMYDDKTLKVDDEDRDIMRAALEAAAPHMLAEAWDAAIQDADDQGYLYEHQSNFMKSRNPYRPTP